MKQKYEDGPVYKWDAKNERMTPENPRLASFEIIALLGVTEALVLGQLIFWVTKSKHLHSGKYWVYNTYSQWQEQLPHVSSRTIQRAIQKLEENGFIVSQRLSSNRYNKVKYYTVDFDKINSIVPKSTHPSCQYESIDSANLAPSIQKNTTEENIQKTSLVNSTQEQSMQEFKKAAKEGGVENLINLLSKTQAVPPEPPKEIKPKVMMGWFNVMVRFHHKDGEHTSGVVTQKNCGQMKHILEQVALTKATSMITTVVIKWDLFRMKANAITGKSLPLVPNIGSILENINLALMFEEEVKLKPVQLIAVGKVSDTTDDGFKSGGKKGW